MSDNEAIVRSILSAFGSFRVAAKKLGISDSTVYFWAKNKNIPAWRREEVLRAASRRRIKLTEAQKEYLKSKERFPTPNLNESSNNDGSCSGMSEEQQPYTFAALTYNKEF